MPSAATSTPPATHFDAVGSWRDEWHGVRVEAMPSGGNKHVRFFDTMTANSSFLDSRHHLVHNPRSTFKDVVYILINMSWAWFTACILGFSALITVVFALVFHFLCVDTDVFEDAFNLSYQSYSTIGFGILYPRNACGNLALSMEAFVSMILLSAISGLVFVRFSKPRATVVFASKCVVQPYSHHLALVVRVANATRCRHLHQDSILEASFRVNLLRIEERSGTDSTLVLRRYDLPTLQADFLAIRRDIQLVHVIDERSPLRRLTETTLAASDFAIQVDLVGVDSTTQNTVQCQMLYSALQVEWGAKFQDMCKVEGVPGNEQWVMDFDQLSTTVPAHVTTPRRPSAALDTGASPYTTGSPMLPVLPPRQLTYAKSCQFSIKDEFMQTTGGDLVDQAATMGTQYAGSPGTHHVVDMPPCEPPSTVRPSRTSRRTPDELTESLLFHEMPTVVHSPNRRASVVSSAANVENAPHFDRILPRHVPLPFSFHTVYTEALKTSWPWIIGYSFVAFIALNVLFAFVYYLDMDGVSVYDDIRNNNTDFGVCFYYSVHTLSTVGYGAIGPKSSSTYQNFWIMVESTLGIVVITIFTGISWSKFSRPRAHIEFSNKAVVTHVRDGTRVLLVRALNLRTHGNISGNAFRVGVTEVNKHTNLRQVHDVDLVNMTYPSMNVPATLVHVITSASPFAKFKSIDDFLECNVQMLCLYSGIDHTFSTNVYARKMYTSEDFVVGDHFADCAEFSPEGGMAVDFDRFHVHERSLGV
ncbi:hypothetical protein H310_11319 [Aphanomyces invadans]|uniref:Inward rectifier potassium channel C-terminal domain-containing protein n=1 Tax=Aphanomyces invadans TaxID=157072 RepID=A0A024TMZ8_9STRA|nr:hypothetical protein H310_11319 [Aphanomyces invadans]ETV94991.1 hypothetical protein H310_11319 [Aphanomyces invadans]|eukprot:XP_008876165.1 hypothetical protein H310_11319 [Aphanomyces invadans]